MQVEIRHQPAWKRVRGVESLCLLGLLSAGIIQTCLVLSHAAGEFCTIFTAIMTWSLHLHHFRLCLLPSHPFAKFGDAGSSAHGTQFLLILCAVCVAALLLMVTSFAHLGRLLGRILQLGAGRARKLLISVTNSAQENILAPPAVEDAIG